MKKFFIEAQRKFKEFKRLENLTGDCIHQIESDQVYEEKWALYPKTGGVPQTYYLKASIPHNSVHVRTRTGKMISISEIDASGIAPIRLND